MDGGGTCRGGGAEREACLLRSTFSAHFSPPFPTLRAPLPFCPPGAQWDPHRLRVTAVPVSLSHQRATVTSATGCPQREGSAGDEGGPVGPSHEEGALIVRCAKQGGCVLEPAW